MMRMNDHRLSYTPTSAGLGPIEPDVRRVHEQLRLAMRGLIVVALARGPDADLQVAMSELCTVAHKEQITVERVLIVLRAEWDAADKPSLPHWNALEEIRARLASHCIEQFYAMRS